MFVEKRMTRTPITIKPDESLAIARTKMSSGLFRRLPVVENGKLVGIVTDRDVRTHWNNLDSTSARAAMTAKVLTVSPKGRLEHAAELMVMNKIGGLPVVEEGKLVGIITLTDIVAAFLDLMGVREKDAMRLDLVLKQGKTGDFSEASKIIAREGGQISGLGTYREQWDAQQVFYFLIRSDNGRRIAKALEDEGFEVLGIH
jgi:acetoin utilization protein AcuB